MQASSGPSGPAPADGALPIDLDHLSRQTFGDRDLQAELLDLFARQAKGILAALDASLGPDGGCAGAPATPRAAELLHTLCGSARAVGSWGVAAAAENMERDLRRPAGGPLPPDGRDRLAALNRSVGQACAVIDDLSQRKSA